MGSQVSQFFPPKAKYTEHSLPDLTGKVYIVTGSSAGVGKELARLLYSRNATVYVAARSPARSDTAIQWMNTSHPESKGTLHFLRLDLNNLEGIKASANEFLAKESRLDVLYNNAGVATPPEGSTTQQGYELQLGTNCVAPFLFTQLLTPLLAKTAKSSPNGAVRMVWVSSAAATMSAPKNGVDMSNLDYKKKVSKYVKYGTSKGGNVLLAIEYGRRCKDSGIISISINPGNLKTELQRYVPSFELLLVNWLLYPAINGAYTELFAGIAPEAANIKENEWVVPFGRIMPLRQDYAVTKTAGAFWEWCEAQTERYA